MDEVTPFRIDRSTVLKQLLLNYSISWSVWVVLSVGLIMLAVGCFCDVRLIVLGLMVCVAVTPSILVLIYFFHSLSPAVVPNLLPHTIERKADGYLVQIWRLIDSEEDLQPGQNWKESESIRLFDCNIVNKKYSFDYEMLFFKDSRLNILYVPRY